MRHGVLILPEHSWPRARQTWELAEAFGFDHAWTYDHIRWRWLRSEPWFSAVPTLTAAAAVTSRIRLGTLVASPGLRHPVTFAKEVMSLDDVSGGRAVCGVGAGGYEVDLLQRKALQPAERTTRFVEFAELTDLLLRQEPHAYDGTYYQSADLVMEPGCVQRPRVPLAVAAAGPRGMRVAARLADIWVTSGIPGRFDPMPYEQSVGLIREQMEAVDEACAAVGRDPATLGRLLLTGATVGGVLESLAAYEDAAGAFADVGVTDMVVHWPRDSFPYKASMEVLEEVASTVLQSGAGPHEDLERRAQAWR